MKVLNENHWFNNSLADLMTHEFCLDDNFVYCMPRLLINFDDGSVRGQCTISNPFKILNRYEYSLALIDRCNDNYTEGVKVVERYLQMAILIKGTDDELVQKFTVLSKKWQSFR